EVTPPSAILYDFLGLPNVAHLVVLGLWTDLRVDRLLDIREVLQGVPFGLQGTVDQGNDPPFSLVFEREDGHPVLDLLASRRMVERGKGQMCLLVREVAGMVLRGIIRCESPATPLQE